MSIKRRVFATVLGAIFGFVFFIGMSIYSAIFGAAVVKHEVFSDAPHTLPLVKGQTSLRLAMVHDVLLDRHSVHSEAYWRARLEIAKKSLDDVGALGGELKGGPSEEVLNAFDVYGVCLDKLHRSKEAVAVMRRKLALLQQANKDFKVDSKLVAAFTYNDLLKKLEEGSRLTETQKSFYRTYANLGTFLIHASFKGLLAKKKESRAQIVEGIGHIKTSMTINPGAHFGRETWQYVAANHLLYCLDHENQRLDFDINGNSLKKFNPIGGQLTSQGRRLEYDLQDLASYREKPEKVLLNFLERQRIRSHITIVGESRPLSKKDVFIPQSAPFDEPTLGMIGMWTLGGGANPHFSLALANNMAIAGQRYIAWTGYERTKRLAKRFWREEKYHKGLIEFCDKTQKRIEMSIPESRAELVKEFEEELALGRSFQQDYKAYEIRRLKEGLAPNSEGFYDAFFEGRESIASDPGGYDEIKVRGRTKVGPGGALSAITALILGFGLGVFLVGKFS